MRQPAAVIGAFVVVAGAAFACSRPRAAVSTADVPVVAVARAERRDLSQVLTIAAEFRPFQEIEIHAKVAGYVKSIDVDVGDRVKTGQLLAVLEIPELQDDLRQDAAAVKRAGEEINRAQADLERAQSAHEVAHISADRLANVRKARPNLVAQQDIDEASGRDRVSEAQVATARAAVASANEQLEIARAAQNKTQTLLAYSRITAPFAGVITHRYADTGAMIQAGTSSQTQTMPLVRLSQNSLLRLRIPVPESAVPRIRLGERVEVSVTTLSKTFPGTIARFADRLNADTRTMDTEVDVPNDDLELVPGMYASASIALARAEGALSVPVQAIDRSEGGASVLVVRAGKIDRCAVSLGLETPDRVEIKSGLRPDDVVVVGNRSQLRPGAMVTPRLGEARRGVE